MLRESRAGGYQQVGCTASARASGAPVGVLATLCGRLWPAPLYKQGPAAVGACLLLCHCKPSLAAASRLLLQYMVMGNGEVRHASFMLCMTCKDEKHASHVPASLTCSLIPEQHSVHAAAAGICGCTEYHDRRTFLQMTHAIWLSISSKQDERVDDHDCPAHFTTYTPGHGGDWG